ncbi:MAG3090 family protein [Mycoplasmopsis edwardii]|uniref:MAG3090 family protein n=1 Tax=Mycoplasmopsis edwardii TaxID=53558 RepID=UPI000E3DDB5F|nr:hypothetical protein [Mycoplasmopsis edwardii]
MKRLLCLYKPSLDKNYPWALKHPKVDSALALFKTRKDALNWFLSLDYDCATWFQTSKKIFGGLLISEKNSDSVFEFDLDVERFDGKVNYAEALEEIYVSPKTGLRDQKLADKYVDQLKDFKILRDHRTYFPADDDYVVERKKSSKDIQIEKLTQEVNELDELLKDSNGKFTKEIEELKLKLQDSNADKEALLKEIEALRKKIVAESVTQTKAAEKAVAESKNSKEEKKVVEKVEVIKEVIKEVPVYIEKEVIKEVFVESKGAKAQPVESKKYAYINDLVLNKQLESLALYAKKLEKVANSYEKEVITSEKDFNEIKVELDRVLVLEKSLSKSLTDKDAKHLLKLVSKSLAVSVEKLSKVVKGSKDVEYIPAKFVYYRDSKENIRLAQVISYVAYEGKHIGFVAEKDYKYSVFASPSKDSHFLVFESIADAQVVASSSSKEVVKVKDENSWIYTFWSIILYGLAYIILLALVIVLAIAYFG